MFVHLKTRSHYSFLYGLSSPTELAYAAARSGSPAIALTDYRYLAGAIEFYEACHAAGVQPVLGLEIDVLPPAGLPALERGADRLLLLATGQRGWSGLCRISSALLGAGPSEHPSALSFDALAQESAGLLCLAGGRGSYLALISRLDHQPAGRAYLGQLGDIFADRLYIGLQRNTAEEGTQPIFLARLAKRLELGLVATPEVSYLKPDQAGLQRLVTAIRLNCRLEEVPEDEAAPPGAHFLEKPEMEALYANTPEALTRTFEIAERCHLELPLGVPQFPSIKLPEGKNADQVLALKAMQGARQLYGEITPSLKKRLDHELAVIATSGYAVLFLVMEEILGFARRRGIPHSSRGSAASSLVAHCLGITSPDPIRLNLYFERFLNPARLTPPDIDTDLCSQRRDEVIDYVYERFGQERVAMVCTVNRFRRRSALREAAKAHGLSPDDVTSLVNRLPQRWYGPPQRQSTQTGPYSALEQLFNSPLHQTIFRAATALLGLPRHLSIHPGGLVIAPGQLTDMVPTLLAPKGVRITQLDLDAIERLGLVKIDLLGIRGLSVIGEVARNLHAEYPPSSGSPLEVLEAIPEDDPDTAELVRTGRTIGCFQIESPGMRLTLKEVQADSVDDIMVALALYRPGPLTGGLKDAFVRRLRGDENVEHLHPALQPLLEDTYGVILYQEQVLRIAHELAGLSLEDADLLRRAMSHFDPGERMKTLQERFIRGAQSRADLPEQVAERVWELMAAFAGYGFPKAHAASYAQVAWRAAWCKTHHPAIFLAAVLANWGGYYSQSIYLMEARRMGLGIHPPHINHAQREFSVSYQQGSPQLFMGLDQVRDLTRRTQRRILNMRPFHSLGDFLARVDPRPVEADNLVRCGALDGLGSIPGLLHQLESHSWQGGQLPLFTLDEPIDEDWPLEEKVSAQEAILGAGLSAHRLDLVADQIAEFGALTTVEAAARSGQRVRVAGMRQSWRPSQTVRGDYIYFMALEDLESMLDVVIFGDVYRRYRAAFSSRGPYIVEGTVEMHPNSSDPVIRAERIWSLGKENFARPTRRSRL